MLQDHDDFGTRERREISRSSDFPGKSFLDDRYGVKQVLNMGALHRVAEIELK